MYYGDTSPKLYYIAFFSDTFFKNISYILALSVAGAGFLYEEKRKEQSV